MLRGFGVFGLKGADKGHYYGSTSTVVGVVVDVVVFWKLRVDPDLRGWLVRMVWCGVRVSVRVMSGTTLHK